MTNRIDLLLQLAGLVQSHGGACCLVGGLAVSVRVSERFTRDIDLAVAVRTDAEAERLLLAVQGAGLRIAQILEQTATRRLATARLVVPGPAKVELDLLFASCGIEPEIVGAAEVLALAPGKQMHVARIGHLIAMKLLSVGVGREQDTADLRVLCAAADAVELDLARAAVHLIEARGCQRDKDLPHDLDEWLRRTGRG